MVTAALCLSLWLLALQVRGSYVPPKMNRTIDSLLRHYKIPSRERFNGQPVFPKDWSAGPMEARRLFMAGVLETYEKLIGQMLQQLPAPPTPPTPTAESNELPAAAGGAEAGGGVRAELSYVLKKVQELRRHRYQEQEALLQELRALGHLQVDNRVVQSKALWELPWLYEEASSLHNVKMERRRRRRQVRRVRSRPSA